MSVITELKRQSGTPAVRPRRRRLVLTMIGLYIVAALVGASLLFAVEPMVAKMLLPMYGGSPMVWNISVLFFQGALLAGYACAHWSQRRFGARKQPLVHVILILLPLLTLPVSLPIWSVAPESAPTALWLLLVLVAMAGAPFVVLATTGPLVQRWYSWSGLPCADDPYFLYAAGNVGSFLALLGYPFVIEPAADLATQARWWTVGYVIFGGLMIACAALVRRHAKATADIPETPPRVASEAGSDSIPAEKIDWRRRARWVGLASIPSSLFLGVTTHISTDIAPIPLMWVVPLALYLATFIIAFSARRQRRLPVTVRLTAVSAVVVPWILVMFGSNRWLLAVDLALVFAAGLACHGLLARDRPAPQRLTEFFLCVSIGGVLGGVFNGLIAPVAFTWGAELPLAVAALALIPLVTIEASAAQSPTVFRGWRSLWSWVVPRWALSRTFLLTAPTAVVVLSYGFARTWVLLLGVVTTVIWACYVVRRPWALAASAVFAVVTIFVLQARTAPMRERTFFGSYQVNERDGVRFFLHGTTLHGFQVLDPAFRGTPTSYFTRGGPLGDVFATFGDRPASGRVAVVGLGIGTVAAYGRAGQQMDFYEIDPAVDRIARSYFSYLRDCPCTERTIVGDGRLNLQAVTDGTYGMILLDAFSSDAVPVHLLTRQAMQLYVRKLTPGGVLMFNVTNRNVRLAPMLAATARSAGLSAIAADDMRPSTPLARPSAWVAIARSAAELRPLQARGARWQPVRGHGPVWTDSYSSVFDVLRL